MLLFSIPQQVTRKDPLRSSPFCHYATRHVVIFALPEKLV
jgi:hypothetical protein